MANHVSSLKRARQTERKTAVNRANKTRVRSSLRALREALQKGDAKSVGEQYRATGRRSMAGQRPTSLRTVQAS